MVYRKYNNRQVLALLPIRYYIMSYYKVASTTIYIYYKIINILSIQSALTIIFRVQLNIGSRYLPLNLNLTNPLQ